MPTLHPNPAPPDVRDAAAPRRVRRLHALLPVLVALGLSMACSDAPLVTDPGALSPPEVAADMHFIDPFSYCSGGPYIPEFECGELIVLYNVTDGGNWRFQDGWGTQPNPCTWYGVTCENGTSGSVVALEFPGNELKSAVFPIQFTRFPKLEVLDLRGNDLTGALPPEIGNLTRLRVLDLSFLAKQLQPGPNGLLGPLPPELGQLTALEEISLGFNAFLTGPLPASIGSLSSLRVLDAVNSNLSGPLPASMGNLGALETLRISNNALGGALPAELGNLTGLKTMSLFANQFTGSIPASFGNLASLEVLSLGGNDLTGTIPASFGDLDALRFLGMGGNHVTGPLPAELADMQSLESLELRGNPIGGEIPAWIGSFPSLRELHLNEADLGGPIPPELGDFGSQLEDLILYGNQLSGPIPEELALLTGLRNLFLSGNQLTGNVPAELGQLTGLSQILLDDNPLSGLVPLPVAALELFTFCRFEDTELFVPDTPEYRALVNDVTGQVCGLDFTPADDLEEDVVEDVEDLVPGTLNEGQGNALLSKLDNAIAKADEGKYQVAVNLASSFINQVESLVNDGTLTQAEAQPLLDQAQALVLIWSAMI